VGGRLGDKNDEPERDAEIVEESIEMPFLKGRKRCPFLPESGKRGGRMFL
jgi:hypothetical protein